MTTTKEKKLPKTVFAHTLDRKLSKGSVVVKTGSYKNTLTKAQEKRFDEEIYEEMWRYGWNAFIVLVKQHLADELARERQKPCKCDKGTFNLLK